MADRWERELPCRDACDRPRRMHVFISEHNQVGLRVPPGDSATISPAGIYQLRQELVNAAVEADRRGARP